MGDEHRRFKFVTAGPWAGWSEDEIEREILGGPAIVVPAPDDDEDENEDRSIRVSSAHLTMNPVASVDARAVLTPPARRPVASVGRTRSTLADPGLGNLRFIVRRRALLTPSET